ncbi:Coenzyme PQQ synthesis protein D (PqqD) [Arthrobacter sp. cf158]|uniref:PqqD family protein n=1 Tax=Arthrobacter sp. cf158 TaxID=1761744 RepID=UPI00089BC540|nr:PqqD family protein [Arthrobacter sp. cf158]SDX01976.1 Coenzyme PQQ synthesis protein D (PqqD) [Arthrobacter sp. cf158]
MHVTQFWHKAKAVAEVPTHGEERWALLNLNQGSPLVLLGSAAAIWELIDGTRTEGDILQELNRAFLDVNGTSMAEQVRSFLTELSVHGLAESIERSSAAQPDGPSKGAEPRY